MSFPSSGIKSFCFVSISESFHSLTSILSQSRFTVTFRVSVFLPVFPPVGLRPPVGRPGSALPPGYCWRSSRASRRSPGPAGPARPRRTPPGPPSPRCPPARPPARPPLQKPQKQREVRRLVSLYLKKKKANKKITAKIKGTFFI